MGRIACCLALLAVYLTAGALATETTVRGAAPGAASRHRELWGTEWSFANLMYHLNVCPPPHDCPAGPPAGPLHPCGCPDCSKPHPPDAHFANGYCYGAGDAGASSTSTASDEEATSDSTEESTEDSAYEDSPTQANWRFNPLWYLVGGAGVALIAAAIVMQKRKRDQNESFLDDDGSDNNMFSNMSRSLGLMAAGAGLGAFAGKNRKYKEMDDDDLSGSVSRRIRSIEVGDESVFTAPYFRQEESEHPVFVNIPSDRKSKPGADGADTVVDFYENLENIEVEGPYRPSTSNYAVV